MPTQRLTAYRTLSAPAFISDSDREGVATSVTPVSMLTSKCWMVRHGLALSHAATAREVAGQIRTTV